MLDQRAPNKLTQNTATPTGGLADKSPGNNTPSPSIKINISAELAAPVIKSVLTEYASKQAVELPIGLKNLVSQLLTSQAAGSQELVNKVLRLVPENISLQIKPTGDANLLIQHPKLVANLPLSVNEIAQLAPLKISGLAPLKAELLSSAGHSEASKILNTVSPPATANSDALSKDAKTLTNLPSTQQVSVARDNAVMPLSGSDNKLIESTKLASPPLADLKTLRQVIENHPASNSVITAPLLSSKPQQSELLQSLLRIALPKADLASNVLSKLDNIVSDPATFKGLPDTSTQDWLKQLSLEIKQSVPQGKDQDASQIKQLLTTPATMLSTVQLVTPPASQGLLSGLITLLQVSLAARLMRNQPSQAERIAQVLPSIFTEPTATSGAVNPLRAMQDLAQLEQRQQLIREMTKLLAEHQSNKLNNAEKLLQGQDAFYYNLPTAFAGVFKNIELLIKRDEQRDQQNEQPNQSTQSWQLTIKLSVGELGELLSKAKLRQDELELDFYASNDAVLKQLMNFLPLLKRRLESLGIEVSKSQCQLGKIPDTLDHRSYHIFQAKA